MGLKLILDDDNDNMGMQSTTDSMIEDEFDEKNKEIPSIDFDERYEGLNKRYIQVMADLSNYKKRTEKEKTLVADNQTLVVINKLLPLIDSLENGIKYQDETDSENTICILYQLLKKSFEELGIEEINDKGMLYNPRYNEAISTKRVNGIESGMIITVLRKGYKYHHQIIRPSIVEVAQ